MATASPSCQTGSRRRAAELTEKPVFTAEPACPRGSCAPAKQPCVSSTKEKGRNRFRDHAPLSLFKPLTGLNYIFGASLEASAAGAEASEASAAGAEASAAASDSTASVAGASGAFSEQPARAKAVPATAARRSLRMRYNPWIEVDRAGPAARRKAYSGGRLLAPINRQFTCLQVLGAAKPSWSSYIADS